MKRRNQLLALFCLLVFAGLGVLYFQHWVVQKPFGIVLFIGEGLTPARLAATRIFSVGAEDHLSVDLMPHVALLSNYSIDFATPDQPAAAAALATGRRANNRSFGIDAEGNNVDNLIELAHRAGRATGIVADVKLTNLTAAAFYAHGSANTSAANLAGDLIGHEIVDVALGGGAEDFLPQSKGGQRNDGRDLLLELRRNGFDLVRTRAELEAIPRWRRPKIIGLFDDRDLAFADQVEARSEQPTLSDLVRRAIELLQFNRGGYLLVVDGGLMRKAAEDNNAQRTLAHTVEIDHAIATARRYVGDSSAVIVCGDAGIGGLTLSGAPFLKDTGIAVLGVNSAGAPWFTWATGPNAKKTLAPGQSGLVSPENGTTVPDENRKESEEPAASHASAALRTAEDAVAFGSGPRTEALHGSMHA
ncbi:MAG: alkaline phosphatase, partial [Chthoniobacterales bacterium]